MSNEIYEIERKFLVKKVPDELSLYESHHIKQAYISTDPTIRIRQKDDEYILTVKGSGLMKKIEYELPLTEEQFAKLSKKIEYNIVEKTRYIIPLNNGLNAELDIYEGFLKGFMNVEVEFSSTKDAILFDPPTWFGKEVTQDYRFRNSNLAKFGIPRNN